MMKNDMRWQILDSKYLLENKWLTVRQDHVRMPSGLEMNDYFVLEYPDWVNVIAITKDGKFVIERQYRHGTQSVDYELCAGTIEKGEKPIDAAKRELLEETGYTGGEWSLYCESYPNPAAMTTTNYSFLARGVSFSGERHLEKTEDISIYLMTLEEVKNLMMKGGIKQGQMLAPLWKLIAEYNL